MQVGSAHEFERIRKDGRVIQMRGNPIEGGGLSPLLLILPPSVKMKPCWKRVSKTELNSLQMH
jgi:hypothetical protein